VEPEWVLRNSISGPSELCAMVNSHWELTVVCPALGVRELAETRMMAHFRWTETSQLDALTLQKLVWPPSIHMIAWSLYPSIHSWPTVLGLAQPDRVSPRLHSPACWREPEEIKSHQASESQRQKPIPSFTPIEAFPRGSQTGATHPKSKPVRLGLTDS
jgi:hypothetical protein